MVKNVYVADRKKRLAMLDLLIAKQRDGNQIDDAGIREEVDTFIFEVGIKSCCTHTFVWISSTQFT